jgi:signal transduction histidine kinase
MKHAQATKVYVRFSLHQDHLALEVRDDGRGFAVEQQTGVGHYGLLGMRERARLRGGALTIDSNPKHGTAVCFVVAGAQDGDSQ